VQRLRNSAYFAQYLNPDQVAAIRPIIVESADRIEKLEARIVTLVDQIADDDRRIEKLEAALREIKDLGWPIHELCAQIARRALERSYG